MSNRGIGSAVFRYFTEHRNTEVHYEDIAAATGFTGHQVQSSISAMRTGKLKQKVDIESPRKGWYVYRGTKSNGDDHKVVPHKAKAEVIALMGDDRLLVTVEGVVYVATPLTVD